MAHEICGGLVALHQITTAIEQKPHRCCRLQRFRSSRTATWHQEPETASAHYHDRTDRFAVRPIGRCRVPRTRLIVGRYALRLSSAFEPTPLLRKKTLEGKSGDTILFFGNSIISPEFAGIPDFAVTQSSRYHKKISQSEQISGNHEREALDQRLECPVGRIY